MSTVVATANTMRLVAGKKHSNPDRFDEWLRDEMMRRELTQSELARKAGISQTLISQWVNGRRTPSILSAKALADGLDLPIEVVLARLGLDPRNQIPPGLERVWGLITTTEMTPDRIAGLEATLQAWADMDRRRRQG